MPMCPSPSEEKEKAMQEIAAHQAREREYLNDQLWAEGKVPIFLIQSPDDPPTFSSEYQTELRTLQGAFRAADIQADSAVMALDSVESFGGQIGEFAISIAKYGSAALPGIVIGWLKARAGRKAKVEFYADGRPKKIEAQTSEQVILMLDAVRREARPKPKKEAK
jgi:hypothetical protein